MNFAAKLDRQLSLILEQIRIRAGSLNAGNRIIVEKWVVKLMEQQSHLEWKKNRNLYGIYLLDMLMKRILDEPFNKRPPDTALPTLPAYIKQYYMRTSTDILTRSMEETNFTGNADKSGLNKVSLRLSSGASVRKSAGLSSSALRASSANSRRTKPLLHENHAVTSATAIYTPNTNAVSSTSNLNVDFGLSKMNNAVASYPPDPVGALLKRIYAPDKPSLEPIHPEPAPSQQFLPTSHQLPYDPSALVDKLNELEQELITSKLRIQTLEDEALNYKTEISSLKRIIEALKAEDFALEQTARQIHNESLSMMAL